MSSSTYTGLFARVREHCRNQAWYGPDAVNPSRSRLLTEEQSVSNLWDDMQLLRFAFPPATEPQLSATESALGFPLPPLLRALYGEVANGGFGPAYGMIGVKGGAPHFGGWYQDIAEGFLSQPPNVRWVDFADYPPASDAQAWFSLRYEDGHENPDDDWYEQPQYLLPFCYWGCNVDHQIHAITGQIYARDAFSYALWEPSLEAWLELWLNGTLKQE